MNFYAIGKIHCLYAFNNNDNNFDILLDENIQGVWSIFFAAKGIKFGKGVDKIQNSCFVLLYKITRHHIK